MEALAGTHAGTAQLGGLGAPCAHRAQDDRDRGLSSNLQPYLPGVFYYHYGFHALSAFFSALAGWEPAQTVLWFGQLINAAVSLSVYAFTKQWSGNWKTALLAGLFSAFVAKMPGFYLSWGRYTFLLAMALLPLAMAQSYRLMKEGGRRQSGIALTLLVVGVLLSHYVAAFLLLLFLFILGGWQILNSAVSKQPLSKVSNGSSLSVFWAGSWLCPGT